MFGFVIILVALLKSWQFLFHTDLSDIVFASRGYGMVKCATYTYLVPLETIHH